MVRALISVFSIAVTLTKAEGSKILANGFARICFEAVIFDTLLRSLDLAREDKFFVDSNKGSMKPKKPSQTPAMAHDFKHLPVLIS